MGVVGLLIAAIFAAALSSIASELNALSTVTAVDLYEYGLKKPPDDAAKLRVGRFSTVLFGALATGFALFVGTQGPIIDTVNQVGSYFYGGLLGVFILAVAVPRANGHGAFVGLLAGVGAVAATSLAVDELAFLYLNVIGTGATVGVGVIVSLKSKPSP